MGSKKALAAHLVRMYQGADAAKSAQREFESVFSQRDGIPDDVPEFQIASTDECIWIVKRLRETGLAASNGEARRLIRGGGVTVDGAKVTDEGFEIPLEPPRSLLLRKGKLGFARVVLARSDG